MSKKRYSIDSPSYPEIEYLLYSELVAQRFGVRDQAGAMQAAIEWAGLISRDLRLQRTLVWKSFKRTLAARWFGAPEHRVFTPGWQVQDVLDYAQGFAQRNIRVSSFTPGIACRSDSLCLVNEKKNSWPAMLDRLNRQTLIEVFPESSSPSGICFRRFGSAFGEEVVFEAGTGQAMFVWEAEQGMHPFVSISCRGDVSEVCRRVAPDNRSASRLDMIERNLRILIRQYEGAFRSKWFSLCRRTGIESFAIEGYFDPTSLRSVTVVDMDLPFDYVFMGT